MRVVAAILALLLSPLLPLSQAETRQVCLNDQVGLNGPTKASFFSEFQFLAGPRGVRLTESGCEDGAIELSLKRQADDKPADVLGAARVEGSRVTPHLEIYFEPVIETLPAANCWTVIGRALARVAAHEVSHFLQQSTGHSEFGLMQARFTGEQLAGDDSYPFR